MPGAGGAFREPSRTTGEAVRLFNEQAYYESHDLFEEEWAGARGPRREALKALVKIAAGMYHLQTSGFAGAESLLSSGLAALAALPSEEFPVELPPLREPALRCLDKVRALRSGGAADWQPEDVPRLRLRRSGDAAPRVSRRSGNASADGCG